MLQCNVHLNRKDKSIRRSVVTYLWMGKSAFTWGWFCPVQKYRHEIPLLRFGILVKLSRRHSFLCFLSSFRIYFLSSFHFLLLVFSIIFLCFYGVFFSLKRIFSFFPFILLFFISVDRLSIFYLLRSFVVSVVPCRLCIVLLFRLPFLSFVYFQLHCSFLSSP